MTDNKLLNNFLEHIDDPKTRGITRAILEQEPDVDPVYKQINNLFIAFVNASIIADKAGTASFTDRATPNHIYTTMVKLLYTQAVIFNSNMLPVICAMFIYHCGKELKLRGKKSDEHWRLIYPDNDTEFLDTSFLSMIRFITDCRTKYSYRFRGKPGKVTYIIGGDAEIVRAVEAVALLMDNPFKVTVSDPKKRLEQYYYFSPKNKSTRGDYGRSHTCYINCDGILYPKEKAANV